MGAAASAPVSATQTQDTLNFILKEMFSRADLVDMYSLADPARCKKFIVVAADALEQLFVKIRLYPQKDKQGIFYFQSVDGLTKAQSAAAQEAQAAQRKYCLELAFFFIRIFQTFAALYLTIFDTTLPPVDPADEVPTPSSAVRKATFIDPKTFLGAQVGIQPKSFLGRGGALRTDGQSLLRTFYLRNPVTEARYEYSLLNKILSPPEDPRDITAPMTVSRYPGLLSISQSSLYDFTNDDPATRKPKAKPVPILRYLSTRMTKTSNMPISIQASLSIVQQGPLFSVKLTDAKDLTGGARSAPPLETTIPEDGIYAGREFPAARGKGLDDLLHEMMRRIAVSMYGEPELSVVSLLKGFGYVSGYADKAMKIEGTQLYILKDQEKLGKVRVVYQDSVVLPEDTTRTDVSIDGYLEIERVQPFPDGGNYKYRVRLTFEPRTSRPRQLQDRISFPENPRAVTFTASAESTGPRDPQDRTIPDFLKARLENLVKQQAEEVEDRSGIKYTRQGFPMPVDTEDIPEDLRVKALWKALAKDPPIKSHCVARATQLLSVAAIRGQIGDSTFSSACRLTFRYQKDGSLPTPGEPITKEHGLMALATLFVEALEGGLPKIVDKPRYMDFLKRLRYLFEKYPTLEAAPPASRIGEIEERLDPMCKSIGDAPLPVKAPLGKELKAIAGRLLSQQQAHIGSAMALIFKLFDRDAITRRRVFALSPAILAGGTPAVNAVAAEARDLLLRYYTSCETTYREGLVKIYQSNLSAPEPKINAAPPGRNP